MKEKGKREKGETAWPCGFTTFTFCLFPFSLLPHG